MRHDEFEGRTDIVSAHTKQDFKVRVILNALCAMDPNEKNSFVLTKQEYQFMNNLE